jgi:cytochrome P450
MIRTIPNYKVRNTLGTVQAFRENPLEFLKGGFAESGPVFKFNLITRTLVATSEPEHIKRLLQDNNRNYRKSPAYEMLKLALGNGLFTSEGDFWLRQRRMAAPAFHRKEIDAYRAIMQEETALMLQEWSGKETVDISAAMTHLTLKIICRALLGLSLDEEKGRVVEEMLPPGLRFLIERIQRPVNLPMWIPTRSHRQFNRTIHLLHEIIDHLIQTKEKQLGNDLLSQLIKARDDEGKGMTHQQLKDEVMTFFLAGHETTAVSAVWSVWLIKTNPAVEERLLEAIDKGDDGFVMAVIQEAMRLLSPVWLLGRESIDADQLGEYHIGKKQPVIFSPLLIHRDPRFWKDPQSFRPERFLEGDDRPKFTYFPFGGGPRLCIGNHFALQELLIMLTGIFGTYRLRLEDQSFPGADYTLTLRPKNHVIARIEKRQKKEAAQ